MYRFSLLKKQRPAFTMLELIFVIIILGIVASIGSSIIVQVYESYIIQKAIHNASIKTQLALNQLGNRLVYRIDQSMLARDPNASAAYVEGTNVYPIREVPIADINTFTALEWIGYENDGFAAFSSPAWSGVVDLNASSYASLTSTASNFTNENTILDNLAGGSADDPAIIFLGDLQYRNAIYYSTMCMYSTSGCIFPVTLAGTTLTFTGGGDRVANSMVYTEMYQLAASAYTVLPVNPHTIDGLNVWDLHLYYNYQPWLGDTYTSGSSATLLKNVSVFRYKHEINSLRIKLCTVEKIGQNAHISICKEKAVIR